MPVLYNRNRGETKAVLKCLAAEFIRGENEPPFLYRIYQEAISGGE